MEIQVGEYVRTKNGKIYKSDECQLEDNEVITYAGGEYEVRDTIVNHSFDLIDLIEKGDYVNGKLVSNVDKVDNMIFIEWDNGDMYTTEIQNDKFIKSIVTKEMFSSIEYRLEEK